jgi:chemotaxis receptor (MCP) glutamine deamidase CheD
LPFIFSICFCIINTVRPYRKGLTLWNYAFSFSSTIALISNKELLKKVIAAGASKTRLVAKIAGGAKMFEVSGLSDVGNIGARNAEAAKKILKEKGIRLVAEDTGLNYGRTVELHCDTGEFLIKSVGKPIKTI